MMAGPLADERLRPGLLGHQPHQLSRGRVVLAGEVDQQGELLVGDLGEAARSGAWRRISKAT
jgi:hypothetical protein